MIMLLAFILDSPSDSIGNNSIGHNSQGYNIIPIDESKRADGQVRATQEG